MSAMASQITGMSIVCSIVCSGADQRKRQSTVSLAFVRESSGDRWFPSQRASNAENVSIRWRPHDIEHHDMKITRKEANSDFVQIINLQKIYHTSPEGMVCLL